MTRLIGFVKQTFVDVIKIAGAKERIQAVLGVSLYRNALYIMLNSAILALTGFFFWTIAARLYPVEGVGLASAAISATGLLALLSTLGLTHSLIRFLPESGDNGNKIINSCFTISGLVSIALSLIFLAGIPFWSPALSSIREHPVFFAAFVIFTAAITLQSFTRQTFIAKRGAVLALWQGLIFGLVRFIPLVVLVTLFKTFGIFASWGIAASIAVIISALIFIPKIQAGYRPLPVISKAAISEMMPYSFANYSAELFWFMPTFILPLMVINLLSAEANACFYIGWAVGSILFAVPAATSLSLFAEGSHRQEKLARDVNRSLKLTLAILTPVILIVLFLGDKILLLFGTTYSENATELLRVLAVSALPLSLNYIYFSIKRVQMRMKGVIVLSAILVVATLALSYILLPKMGIIGAGIAWLSSQVVVAMVAGRELWRRKF